MFTLNLWRGWLLPWEFYFYKVRSPTPWIFALAGFSDVSDLDTLRVGPFLRTHCLVGPWSALEGSPFDCFIFDVFGGSSEVVLRKLRFLPARPDLEYLSQFSRRYPSLYRIASYIWLLLDGEVLVGPSWSNGSLLIKGLQSFLNRLLQDC